jgi:hypothetical protein
MKRRNILGLVLAFIIIASLVSVPIFARGAEQSIVTSPVSTPIVTNETPVITPEVKNELVRNPVTGEMEEPVVLPALFVNGTRTEFPMENGQYGTISLTGSGTYTLTATEVLPGSIEINGTGTWSLGSAIELTGTLVVIQGTFDTKGYNLKTNSIYLGEYRVSKAVTMYMRSSYIETFSFAVRGNTVTLDAGTSTLVTTLLFDNSTKSGKVYYNVKIKSDNKVYGFVEGNSKFNDLTFENDKSMYLDNSIDTNTTTITKGTVKPNLTPLKPINKPVITARKDAKTITVESGKVVGIETIEEVK